jgi:5-formyltetrahydrofolate cyclo-ligase
MSRRDKKAALRKYMLEARRTLDRIDVVEWSKAILSRVQQLEAFQQAGIVLTYVDSKDNEVETRPLITRLIEQGRSLAVPVANTDGTMIWSRIESLDDLAPGCYDILEPKPDRLSPITVPDDAVVLVPGIAFDRAGYRIGYGGGYFDRFLPMFEGAAIALAFSIQLTDTIPHEPHDRPVHVIATELETIRCR